jgi:hypothetical protein
VSIGNTLKAFMGRIHIEPVRTKLYTYAGQRMCSVEEMKKNKNLVNFQRINLEVVRKYPARIHTAFDASNGILYTRIRNTLP